MSLTISKESGLQRLAADFKLSQVPFDEERAKGLWDSLEPQWNTLGFQEPKGTLEATVAELTGEVKRWEKWGMRLVLPALISALGLPVGGIALILSRGSLPTWAKRALGLDAGAFLLSAVGFGIAYSQEKAARKEWSSNLMSYEKLTGYKHDDSPSREVLLDTVTLKEGGSALDRPDLWFGKIKTQIGSLECPLSMKELGERGEVSVMVWVAYELLKPEYLQGETTYTETIKGFSVRLRNTQSPQEKIAAFERVLDSEYILKQKKSGAEVWNGFYHPLFGNIPNTSSMRNSQGQYL